MSIISSVGRRDQKTRLLMAGIYLLLSLGALSMIYPLLLMLGGSTKSGVDAPMGHLVPSYLVSDQALYQKHLEGLFNESAILMQDAYGRWDETFSNASLPTAASPIVDDWNHFLELETGQSEDRSTWFFLGYFQCPISRNSVPINLRKFRNSIVKEEGGIQAVNKEYGTFFVSPSSILIYPVNYLNRFVDRPDSTFLKAVESFASRQPLRWRVYGSVTNYFRSYLQLRHGRKINVYNQVHGSSYRDWSEVPIGSSFVTCEGLSKEDFDEFARGVLNPVFVEINGSASKLFSQYLKEKYRGNLVELNQRHQATYASFETVVLPTVLPQSGAMKSDWRGFLEGWENPETGKILRVPTEAITLRGPDFEFRRFLQRRYGDLTAMNQALKSHYTSWGVVGMPQREKHDRDFQEMRASLRWHFTVRNYVDVVEYLVLHGRGLLNTLVYCLLSVAVALTVDPLAAYALSRFKPPGQYGLLMMMMMTMAFPVMVTQIPTFLLLRDFGLLNSYWALILPGMVNGFNIFLLKGFFDSLPRELYESAQMDGASEWTIFSQITLRLSMPILSVIALGAFTSAYAAFMFALLLCQDPEMWTLMVWLFQLKQVSGPGIIFASLLLASGPMIGVFLLCQRIILSGQVVPSET